MVSKCLTSNACKAIPVAILVAILLTASCVVPALAQTGESSITAYEDINVDIAYDMITSGSFPNLVILDVRNQSEYDLGHLYGAILIPYYQLDTRIGELEEQANDEIIVYCKSGYRSQIACEILVSHGFTKVYNMIGGILAWMEAGYPIYTTYHHVTVNVVDGKTSLEIEPWLLYQKSCVSCSACGVCDAGDQTCTSDSEPANIQYTVLQEEENYTLGMLTYEVNGTTFEVTIANTLLWSYNELADEANRTASFVSTEITAQDMSMRFYSAHRCSLIG